MNKGGQCEWVRFKASSTCAVCGYFGGWREDPAAPKAECDRLWREFQREQQRKHAAQWQRQLDSLSLAPMANFPSPGATQAATANPPTPHRSNS